MIIIRHGRACHTTMKIIIVRTSGIKVFAMCEEQTDDGDDDEVVER